MKRKIITYFFLFLILFLGWFLFRLFNPGDTINPVETGFTAWLWQKRGLDLAVQVVLVFAGALGIAAILPVEDEDDN